MQETKLLKYIKTIINDESAMNILFYSVKKAMSDNGFNLSSVQKIEINEIYQEQPAIINIKDVCPDRQASFALLLSLRALILFPNLLKECYDDRLLFMPHSDRKYGWSHFTSLVLNCYSDDEFSFVFGTFKSLVYNGVLHEEDITILNSFIVEPERKFLINYFQRLANSKLPHKYVVLNNAHVCDDSLESFVIDAKKKYVGNTAFAYCHNLKTIQIEGENVKFGLFPIVECESLEGIVVPKGTAEYYREALPYYKDIIVTSFDDIKPKAKPIAVEQESKPESAPSAETPVSRRGARWTPEEDDEIVELFEAGFSFEDIAEAHGRTVVSIKARLGHLGAIDYVYKKDEPKVVEEAKTVIVEVEKPKPVAKKVSKSPEIDFSKLDGVFKSKATTYKYFWLLAIVGLIKDKGLLAYSFKELSVRMVSEAWQLIRKYDLDFGKVDQMETIISKIKSKAPVSDSDAKSVEIQILAHYDRYSLDPILHQLVKNVPYRFLSPWIKYTNDEDVVKKSNLSSNNTPYAIHPQGIAIDEDWYDYFAENYEKIVKFIHTELTAYLGDHNSQFHLLQYKMHSFLR